MVQSRKNLKPQDLLVAVKIWLLEKSPWRQLELALALGLSQSEITFSLERLKFHHFIDVEKEKILKGALREFCVHGLRYVFPAEIGSICRGVPTSGGAKPLSQKLRISKENLLVWPDDEGTVRGQSLEPLYKTVPFAAKKDPELYEIMVLIDALRAGSTREREIATQILSKRLLGEKFK